MSISRSISVTKSAWNKIENVLKKRDAFSFLLSAEGGGCNGYNYNFVPISKNKYDELFISNKNKLLKPSIIEDKANKIIIDPLSEMLLLGTNIDYVSEDYDKNIFESKFIFTPDKKLATSCGCGVSFSPRNMS
tara:strand:- start:1348 stop:1746 length:399 start_codon:yes stop_codon:yes gene_type:complete